MTLTESIRAALRDTHDRIERLPAAVAMGDGTISRPAYVRLLSQLYAVHAVLEPLLASAPALAGVYRPEMARADVLRADLRAFGAADPLPAGPEALALIERIRARAASAPASLAGCLYVFEGSRMGSMILAKRLAAGFGLPAGPGHGLDYHLDGAAGRMAQWGQFKAAVDGLPLDEAGRASALAAAAETMDGVFAMYAALDPAGA